MMFFFHSQRIPTTFNSQEEQRLLMDLNISMQTAACKYTVQFFGALFFEGEVWICMEVMDKSLDKFYDKVYKNNRSIPENILGVIALSVNICVFPKIFNYTGSLAGSTKNNFIYAVFEFNQLAPRLDFASANFKFKITRVIAYAL